MTNPNEKQVAGSHYASTYQHWDYVRLALQDRYLEGCASKYVARFRKKGGLQDLLKAQHYMEKIIALHKEGVYDSLCGEEEHFTEAFAFCEAQGFDPNSDEAMFLTDLPAWRGYMDLARLAMKINRLVAANS